MNTKTAQREASVARVNIEDSLPWRVFFRQESLSGFDRGAMILTGYSEYLTREEAEAAAAKWEGKQ